MLERCLLLMPCSGMKLAHAEQPRRLYLGPMWQTLRTHIGNLPWANVFVLSGKFGFIGSQEFIQTYDDVLTQEKAARLVERGIHAANDHHGAITYKFQTGRSAADALRPYQHSGRAPFAAVMNAGAGLYADVLRTFIAQFQVAGIISAGADVRTVSGAIGMQRKQLGEWLAEINSRNSKAGDARQNSAALG